MNIEKEILATFVREGWQSGLRALASDRARKATKQVKDADPLAAIQIAKLQREIKFWESDVPSLIEEVNNYAAELAARPK